MVTLRFDVTDLANTRFGISPMDHLVHGVVLAEVHGCPRARRDRWWRRVRRLVPRRAEPFLVLVNASGTGFPDFLTAEVPDSRRSLTDELDTMLAVSEAAFQQDLAMYDADAELPLVIAKLRDGGSRQLQRIADGAWALFHSCLEPDRPDLRRLLLADTAHRPHTMANAGIATMLTGLHPRNTWREDGSPEFPLIGWDSTVDPGGRGLELRPNAFIQGTVTAMLAEDRRPILFHAVSTRADPGTTSAAPDGLVVLIGPARSRALRAIGHRPCSTIELAQLLGITPPSASAHAAALRTAGAITTERQGRRVLHTLTLLGHDLLLNNPQRCANS